MLEASDEREVTPVEEPKAPTNAGLKKEKTKKNGQNTESKATTAETKKKKPKKSELKPSSEATAEERAKKKTEAKKGAEQRRAKVGRPKKKSNLSRKMLNSLVDRLGEFLESLAVEPKSRIHAVAMEPQSGGLEELQEAITQMITGESFDENTTLHKDIKDHIEKIVINIMGGPVVAAEKEEEEERLITAYLHYLLKKSFGGDLEPAASSEVVIAHLIGYLGRQDLWKDCNVNVHGTDHFWWQLLRNDNQMNAVFVAVSTTHFHYIQNLRNATGTMKVNGTVDFSKIETLSQFMATEKVSEAANAVKAKSKKDTEAKAKAAEEKGEAAEKEPREKETAVKKTTDAEEKDEVTKEKAEEKKTAEQKISELIDSLEETHEDYDSDELMELVQNCRDDHKEEQTYQDNEVREEQDRGEEELKELLQDDQEGDQVKEELSEATSQEIASILATFKKKLVGECLDELSQRFAKKKTKKAKKKPEWNDHNSTEDHRNGDYRNNHELKLNGGHRGGNANRDDNHHKQGRKKQTRQRAHHSGDSHVGRYGLETNENHIHARNGNNNSHRCNRSRGGNWNVRGKKRQGRDNGHHNSAFGRNYHQQSGRKRGRGHHSSRSGRGSNRQHRFQDKVLKHQDQGEWGGGFRVGVGAHNGGGGGNSRGGIGDHNGGGGGNSRGGIGDHNGRGRGCRGGHRQRAVTKDPIVASTSQQNIWQANEGGCWDQHSNGCHYCNG